MAIVGVTTGLDITIEAKELTTGLIWFMNDGIANGQSNELGLNNATAALGKSLNTAGDRTAARAIVVALNANV